MRVAVLSLTRERLIYTKHCFSVLNRLAGCHFDHFILDQGSTDGTKDWLLNDYTGRDTFVHCEDRNIGIARGLEKLLVMVHEREPYDVIVKIDNDCEIVTLNCLRDVAQASFELDALLSPTIRGLRYPPEPTHSSTIGQWKVNHIPGNIGGIFLAAPGDFYDGWKFDSELPVWGMDDVRTCQVAHEREMMVGYLDGYEANHYETTDGQHNRYPGYFQRRLGEGGPP